MVQSSCVYNILNPLMILEPIVRHNKHARSRASMTIDIALAVFHVTHNAAQNLGRSVVYSIDSTPNLTPQKAIVLDACSNLLCL